LKRINANIWPTIYDELLDTQQSKYGKLGITKAKSVSYLQTSSIGAPLIRSQSVCATPNVITPTTTLPTSSTGILLTTEDAHTLTDGPTIFLCSDVEKIGKFYVQQSKIPERVFQQVAEKIVQNTAVQKRMDELNRVLEDKQNASSKKEQTNIDDKDKKNLKQKASKMDKDPTSGEMVRLMDQIDGLRAQIRLVSLENAYIPNTVQHQQIWVSHDDVGFVKNAYVPSVDEESVRDIMALDVTNEMKLLLLMGIGMFINEKEAHPKYMEIMKRLAYNQQLFLILASSDYIYGTNYQFCHGFIGKDLTNMTQQKTIQAMGRIGRNAMQQEYSVRFREDEMLLQLFQRPALNMEAEIMCKLFNVKGNQGFP